MFFSHIVSFSLSLKPTKTEPQVRIEVNILPPVQVGHLHEALLWVPGLEAFSLDASPFVSLSTSGRGRVQQPRHTFPGTQLTESWGGRSRSVMCFHARSSVHGSFSRTQSSFFSCLCYQTQPVLFRSVTNGHCFSCQNMKSSWTKSLTWRWALCLED